MSEAPRDSSSTLQPPAPLTQPESELFWAKARQGELWLRRCEPCDRPYFYPRDLCPSCLSRETSWVRSKGAGTLYTFAIVHRAPAKAFESAVPYVIAVVELDEGVRMPTSLVDVPCDPESIHIGMRVEAVYDDVTATHTLVRFRPARSKGLR